MMDKDIKEMFREKNKVILLNNLKYDLDKNINSLLETIINIFNLEFDTAIKNILAIKKPHPCLGMRLCLYLTDLMTLAMFSQVRATFAGPCLSASDKEQTVSRMPKIASKPAS